MAVHSRALTYTAVWAGLALVVAFLFARHDYNFQGGLLVTLVIIPVGFLLARAMARAEGARWFLWLLLVALVLKLGASLSRMFLNILLYGGLYDAGRYHRVGVEIAERFWKLDFGAALDYLYWGTRFTELYSGLVHTVIGPTVSGAYLVFGLLAFVGSFCFYRAFCAAFPQGNRKFYALLAFFFPSVLYWPNGLGKDALMSLFIGVTAYGGALLMSRMQLKGFILLLAGVLGTATIRPHVMVMLVLALVAAFVLRRPGSGGAKIILLQGIVLVAGLVAAWVMIPRVMAYVGLQSLSLETAADYFTTRQTSTGGGGSAFEAPSFTSPFFVPQAVITILFRPYLWEAHNVQALIQAADGALLLGLVVWRAPVLARAVRQARSNPYVIFILIYTVILAISLMTIANFGTLARERAMLLPLFMMLLAFGPPPQKEKRRNSRIAAAVKAGAR